MCLWLEWVDPTASLLTGTAIGLSSTLVTSRSAIHTLTYPEFSQMLRGLQGERIRQAFQRFDKDGGDVNELDLINELYRGRLQQLEQDNQTADNYRHSAELHAKEAAQERAQR
ncbi:hypothetical protein F4778DRAFT_369644 [Xylariomycetidae sp. FL2044]|nr:hypothetical protein F4778DRAFT_369644 [Xylariomycetidae sp. FL2044]